MLRCKASKEVESTAELTFPVPNPPPLPLSPSSYSNTCLSSNLVPFLFSSSSSSVTSKLARSTTPGGELKEFNLEQARLDTAASFSQSVRPEWNNKTAVTTRPQLNDAWSNRTTEPVMPSSTLAFRAKLQPPLVRSKDPNYVPFQTVDPPSSTATPSRGSRGAMGQSRGSQSSTRGGGPARGATTAGRAGSSVGGNTRGGEQGGGSIPPPGTGLVAALLADSGAGDGSWRCANPRALGGLASELLYTGRTEQLAVLLTNPHFLVQKAREWGVEEVMGDLEKAERHFRARLASLPQEDVYQQCEVRIVLSSLISHLSSPLSLFPLSSLLISPLSPLSSLLFSPLSSSLPSPLPSLVSSLLFSLLSPPVTACCLPHH